jgi:hypothetical protein
MRRVLILAAFSDVLIACGPPTQKSIDRQAIELCRDDQGRKARK